MTHFHSSTFPHLAPTPSSGATRGWQPSTSASASTGLRSMIQTSGELSLMQSTTLHCKPGTGDPAGRGGFIPPTMPGHSHRVTPAYDPEVARTLLAKAGYPNGRGFPDLVVGEMLGSTRRPRSRRSYRQSESRSRSSKRPYTSTPS